MTLHIQQQQQRGPCPDWKVFPCFVHEKISFLMVKFYLGKGKVHSTALLGNLTLKLNLTIIHLASVLHTEVKPNLLFIDFWLST